MPYFPKWEKLLYPYFSFHYTVYIVCSGCHNKLPQTERLKTPTIYFPTVMELKIWNQGTNTVQVSVRVPFWLASGHLPPASSWGREGTGSSLMSLLVKTLMPLTKALPSRFHLNLTISQRPHLQMSLHWELLFQHTNFTGTRFCPQYTTQYLKTNIQQLTFE